MESIKDKLKSEFRFLQENGYIPCFEENDYNAGFLNGFEDGFSAGVEFAQRWISADDDLPEKGKLVLTKDNFDDTFDLLLWNGEYWQPCNGVDYGYMCAPEVTHWRPIELK